MRLEERAISETLDTILMHNVMDDTARRVVKKGTHLTEEHLAQLAGSGKAKILVAILGPDDILEDEAARILAEALLTAEMDFSRPAGGRVNLRATIDGLLEVHEPSLLQLNNLPGIALATRRQHTVAGPNQDTDNIASLKIVPFAVERRHLDRALAVATAEPPILQVRPFQPGRRVAMLFVADEGVHDKLRGEYLPPTQARLARLRAELVTTEDVVEAEAAIAAAAARLAGQADLLIVAGHTSIMHDDDITLRALRAAGAVETLSGAPVEPGNLLALAYFPETPVMCAPGCAKGLRRNVVDLVLPRLLLGDRLGRPDLAAMAPGGFLTAAERSQGL